MKTQRRWWTRGDTRVESEYMQTILQLWEKGWTSVAIGNRLGKDHTTILYNLRKLGIQKGARRAVVLRTSQVFAVEVEITPVAPPPPPPPKPYEKYQHLFDEEINPGKSYAEYLKDAGHSKEHIARTLRQKRINEKYDIGQTIMELPDSNSLV